MPNPNPDQVGQYQSYPQAMKAIYAEAGLLTFYTGYWTTVAREIPFSFIQVRARARVRLRLRGRP